MATLASRHSVILTGSANVLRGVPSSSQGGPLMATSTLCISLSVKIAMRSKLPHHRNSLPVAAPLSPLQYRVCLCSGLFLISSMRSPALSAVGANKRNVAKARIRGEKAFPFLAAHGFSSHHPNAAP